MGTYRSQGGGHLKPTRLQKRPVCACLPADLSRIPDTTYDKHDSKRPPSSEPVSPARARCTPQEGKAAETETHRSLYLKRRLQLVHQGARRRSRGARSGLKKRSLARESRRRQRGSGRLPGEHTAQRRRHC